VFQIAAHESIVPPETLYEYCRIARRLLRGEHGVGRVIARPFEGEVGAFKRTANRRDFSLEPQGKTILDMVKDAGLETIAVGKISDIFAGEGVSEAILTHSNREGMEITLSLAERDFAGLCFVNLVDFDMLYGHRRDIDAYATALSAFDAWLPAFLEKLGEDDVLMITADHGCDPAYTKTTDHTREYTPWLVLGKGVKGVNLGTLDGFSHIAATIADLLGVPYTGAAESKANQMLL
jgi:phosphopentomutase